MVKSLRPVKIRRMVKSLRPVKIRRMVKSLRPVKITRLVKSLRPVKIWRMPKTRRVPKTLRVSKNRRVPETQQIRKSGRPYCLGSAESATADISLVPLMSGSCTNNLLIRAERAITICYQLFPASSADFFIQPCPACWVTEEGGERERDSLKMVEERCTGYKERAVAYPAAIHLTYLPRQVEGVQQGSSPPLSPTPHFEHSETSALDLCDSLFEGYEYVHWYWTVMVITFCVHQFLIGRLWAEILTAIVWRKLVKSWWAPIFCRRQYLWHFLHSRLLQISRYSAGESPPIKAGRPAATAHLVTASGELNIFR